MKDTERRAAAKSFSEYWKEDMKRAKANRFGFPFFVMYWEWNHRNNS